MKMKKVKENCFGMFCVLMSAIIAILVHALLPSPGVSLSVDEFDGILVRKFGFPIVASFYFIILYLHILIVIRSVGAKSTIPRREMGIRFGLAFGCMYLVGMQEVVVSASPCDTYGIDFVLYQFFMGLGDAIPVIILCVLVCVLTKMDIGAKKSKNKNKVQETKIIFVVISMLFFIERVVGYYVGYIDNEFQEYPIPVLIWTLAFGMVMGGIYVLLSPIYENMKGDTKIIQLLVWSVGVNWVWFNCFMGLILKGLFLKMFLRGGIDILVITIGCMITRHFFTRKGK